MAFYSEQFKKPGDEDIWEELKYWYQNPITEAEQAKREEETQAWIDYILNKAFGD